MSRCIGILKLANVYVSCTQFKFSKISVYVPYCISLFPYTIGTYLRGKHGGKRVTLKICPNCIWKQRYRPGNWSHVHTTEHATRAYVTAKGMSWLCALTTIRYIMCQFVPRFSLLPDTTTVSHMECPAQAEGPVEDGESVDVESAPALAANPPPQVHLECSVCSEPGQNIRFEPCGHQVACEECATRMKRCIVCHDHEI